MIESGDEEGYNQSAGGIGCGTTTDNEDFSNLKHISYPHTTTMSPRNEYHKPTAMTATINLIEDFLPTNQILDEQTGTH